jgi:hypothetical protein
MYPSVEAVQAAYRQGFRSFVTLSHLVRGNVAEVNPLRRIIRQMHGTPGLLAYYIDEPAVIALPPRVAQMAYALVRRHDPRTPLWINFTAGEEPAAYLSSVDLIGSDPYVLGAARDTAGVATVTQRMGHLTDHHRAVWMIPQAFGWHGAEEPTAAELRNMTYLCVAHGATGIVWFTWRPDESSGEKLHQSEALRQAVRETARELSQLAPVWLAPSVPDQPRAEGSSGLHLLAKEHGAALYLLAVNATLQAVDSTIRGPSFDAGVPWEVIGESRPVISGAGTLRDHFEPLAVHLYKTPLQEGR